MEIEGLDASIVNICPPATLCVAMRAGNSLFGVAFCLQNMLRRFKKDCKVINQHLSKAEFLAEHNKLSGFNLQATAQLMARFEVEKPIICKNGDWSIEKVRRPFIMWLTSLNVKEIKTINRG